MWCRLQYNYLKKKHEYGRQTITALFAVVIMVMEGIAVLTPKFFSRRLFWCGKKGLATATTTNQDRQTARMLTIA